MATKRDKNGHFVKKDAKVEIEGCEHCNNTGHEPGYGLSEAPWCSVCGGSPFTPKDNN